MSGRPPALSNCWSLSCPKMGESSPVDGGTDSPASKGLKFAGWGWKEIALGQSGLA